MFIEQKVAQNPEFRPELPNTVSIPENLQWIISLMKQCWAHESKQRPSFVEIANIFEENKSSF